MEAKDECFVSNITSEVAADVQAEEQEQRPTDLAPTVDGDSASDKTVEAAVVVAASESVVVEVAAETKGSDESAAKSSIVEDTVQAETTAPEVSAESSAAPVVVEASVSPEDEKPAQVAAVVEATPQMTTETTSEPPPPAPAQEAVESVENSASSSENGPSEAAMQTAAASPVNGSGSVSNHEASPASPARLAGGGKEDQSLNTSGSHYEDVEMTFTPVKEAKVEPSAEVEVKRDLFANIRYYLINSTNEDEVVKLLGEFGAAQDKYLSSFITHVICDRITMSDDENELEGDYVEATEVFELKIVRSEWVFKSIFANSLLPEAAFASDSKAFLFGKAKFVSLNLAAQVAKPISALISYHGGALSSELDHTCTHAVLTLDADIADFKALGEFLARFNIQNDSAIQELLDATLAEDADEKSSSSEAKFRPKLVSPDWIVDCVRENKLLDEFKYNPAFSSALSENKALLVVEEDAAATRESEQMDVDAAAAADGKAESDEAAGREKQIFKLNTSSAVINNRLLQLSQAHEKQTEAAKPFESGGEAQSTTTGDADLSGRLDESASASSVSNTPTKKNYKRNRKPAQAGQASGQNGHAGTTATSGSLDMDDIFQSVLLAADDQAAAAAEEAKSGSAKKKDGKQANGKPTTGLLPIYLNLLRPPQSEDRQALSHLSTTFTFDEDSVSQDQYCTQENSHLIQFNRCLLGCVFYLKPSQIIYTQDCLSDWENVITRFGGAVSSEYTAEVTHVLCPNRFVDIYKQAMQDKKRVVTAYWLEDVLQEQKMRPPWLAYHFPSLYDLRSSAANAAGPLTNHIVSTHGFYGKEKLILKTLIWLLNGKYSSYLTNINSFLISKNTVGAKVEKAQKWNIPVVNGVWLSELYLGNTHALTKNLNERYTNINQIYFNNSLINVNHFAYDHMYVSDFMDQWKTLIRLPIEQIKESSVNMSSPGSEQQTKPAAAASGAQPASSGNAPLKQLNRNSPLKRHNRSISPQSPTNNSEYQQSNSNSIYPSSKMTKKDPNSSLNSQHASTNSESPNSISWMKPQTKIPHILFTGFDPSEVIQYQRDVIALGGVIAKQIGQTTHLIVDKIERTAKLLKCISTCDHIVSVQWLIDSKLEGRFKDPNDYQVKDERFEKHYGCCLKESLDRARERKSLFAGLMFYLSPSVRPSYDDLDEMIRSAGGSVVRDMPSLQQLNEKYLLDERKTGFTNKYVVIGAQSDLCILRPLIERNIPIFHEEFVLSGLLKQKIEPNIYKFHAQ